MFRKMLNENINSLTLSLDRRFTFLSYDLSLSLSLNHKSHDDDDDDDDDESMYENDIQYICKRQNLDKNLNSLSLTLSFSRSTVYVFFKRSLNQSNHKSQMTMMMNLCMRMIYNIYIRDKI